MATQNLEAIRDILVCPACKSPVILKEREVLCSNKDCRRSYPISEQGIPNFIIEHSEVKSPAEWSAASKS